jgi:nitrite reductase/ring-hydroxylating ferredoxin subunit/uncharacterized membrane protein
MVTGLQSRSVMRSTAHIKGHPLHPMLIPFPFAFLVGGAVVDVWARVSGQRHWHRTARDMTTLGLGSAIVAAVPGLVDYVTVVPPKSSAYTRATQHMIANLSAVSFFAAARLGRPDSTRKPSAWRLASEIAGAGLLAAGGWLGGTLVTRNQISVDHRYANAGKWRVERIPEERLQGRRIQVSVSDLEPDQMKLVLVGDRRIVVARTDGGYSAFDDRCTHKGGPLSDGVLACGTVQCPWHGSQFDVRTGAVNRGPAKTPIETYEVVEPPAFTTHDRPAGLAGRHS